MLFGISNALFLSLILFTEIIMNIIFIVNITNCNSPKYSNIVHDEVRCPTYDKTCNNTDS